MKSNHVGNAETSRVVSNRALLVFDGENLGIVSDRVTSLGLKSFLKGCCNLVDSIQMSEVYEKKAAVERSLLGNCLRWIPLRRLRHYILLRMCRHFVNTDASWRDRLRRVDVVFVNGEGALHDDRTVAGLLVSVVLVAKALGKKVVVVNATVQNLSSAFLNDLARADLVCVRESLSYKYLCRVLPAERLVHSYDFAWLYLYETYGDYMLRHRANPSGKVLFMKGVGLEDVAPYVTIDHLLVDRKDAAYVKAFRQCYDANTLMIDANGDMDLRRLLIFLDGYDLVVSGRHHLNIVAMFLGIPVLGLPSNTWKVEATLGDLLSVHVGAEPAGIMIGGSVGLTAHDIQRIISSLRGLAGPIGRGLGLVPPPTLPLRSVAEN